MRKPVAALGSAVFFLAGPGTVAGLVPWLLTRWEVLDPLPAWVMIPARVTGAVLLLAGLAGLVDAFVRFAAEGLGTPVPVAPPERLVVGGAYRHVRNPMYVSVFAALLGQALLLGQASVLVYMLVLFVPVWAFVHWYEEPALRRRFGADYDRYRSQVPGWWPRLHPYEG
ncbi:methyltransferase family protein [Thermoactinospora rubra]|uniref:methyltransferase family protein n=1 Tax=Thermoactinospora rubra TaxID=1088767 RepID=UPI000A1226FA|nr:methyltransferase [Thermoactinospora rubra]